MENDDAFITEKMYEAFAEGNYNKVPVIIGCNSEEDVFILQCKYAIKISVVY